MFFVSIPPLIAQFEGLVAETMTRPGRMNFDRMRTLVAEIGRPHGALGEMFSVFVNDGLLAPFEHGSEIPPFSRHAILHGGDVGYGSEVSSRTAILLVDQLRSLLESDRT